MKKILVLFLVFISGNVFSENTIIAIVNYNPILLSSLQNELLSANSKKEKIEVLNTQIDTTLQLQKVNEYNLNPTKKDIQSVIVVIAKNNNITVDELINFDEIDLIKKEISDKLSILNLQRYITKDIEYSKEEVLSKCLNSNFVKDQKQIRIAQIIISEIDSDIKDPDQKIKLIKSFLNKLSKHISNGASFEAFAKLHSQHPSYKDGGLTEWLTVNNPTLEMLDSLNKNEVSKIYSTIFGLAIAIKIDEKFISSKLKECEEQIVFKNAEKYYSDWLKNLRDSAFIEIYYDKLI
ncbi:peptidylprolyl isomerase [Candidatus Thioglobus sp.]|nr:peptidylprolyl isomerase [Candidatus Thioglobus sp.]